MAVMEQPGKLKPNKLKKSNKKSKKSLKIQLPKKGRNTANQLKNKLKTFKMECLCC
jgi:hypothetical protein